jgi:hypothetical protein
LHIPAFEAGRMNVSHFSEASTSTFSVMSYFDRSGEP